MPLGPILSSLSRHRLTVFLLILEVACTCAIVCNVVFMISGRTALMRLPTGLDEAGLSMIDSVSLDEHEDAIAHHIEDLALLSAIPGVSRAVAVDSLPLSGNNWSNGISTNPEGKDSVSASAYSGTPGELSVLGLHLLSGRDFSADEYRPMDSANGWKGLGEIPSTIITRALAQRLFPGEDALGKDVYAGGGPLRIVGIVDQMLRPNLGEPQANGYSMLFPMLPDQSRVTYLMRSAPADRDRVLKAAEAALKARGGHVLRGARTFEQLRQRYFSSDQTVVGLLFTAVGGLLFVTALGIAGLANFWVQQRHRQIGIRRALGASRGDILAYFQSENFLIVSAGIALGMVLAYGLNLLLIQHYPLARLPVIYLPIGAGSMWLLGQLAVLAPALRAARVPPVVAMRAA
jgi:putative ABC transport system permease protein